MGEPCPRGLRARLRASASGGSDLLLTEAISTRVSAGAGGGRLRAAAADLTAGAGGRWLRVAAGGGSDPAGGSHVRAGAGGGRMRAAEPLP